MKITEYEYQSYEDEEMGYCLHCDEITTHNTESDHVKKECESCGELEVIGLEKALDKGHLVLT